MYAEWSGVIDKDMKLTKTETIFACFIDLDGYDCKLLKFTSKYPIVDKNMDY